MQQAYRILRVVSEGQMIRIVLSPNPGELTLKELIRACAAVNTESSSGIKAVVLDFNAAATSTEDVPIASIEQSPAAKEIKRLSHLGGLRGRPSSAATVPAIVEEAGAAVRAIAQPVLAVVRDSLSASASKLVWAADLTLVAHSASLTLPVSQTEEDTFTGEQACRLEFVTWSTAADDISKEMERILDMLREKSAAALRLTKASVRIGQSTQFRPLEALQKVNTFYLSEVMQTADALEGLQAFLEKRKPKWKNM